MSHQTKAKQRWLNGIKCTLNGGVCADRPRYGCHFKAGGAIFLLIYVQLQIDMYLRPLLSVTCLYINRSVRVHLLYTITIAGSNGLYTVAL